MLITDNNAIDRGNGWVALHVEDTGDLFAIGPMTVNGENRYTIHLEGFGNPGVDGGNPDEIIDWFQSEDGDHFGTEIELTEPKHQRIESEKGAWLRAADNLDALAKLCRERAELIAK